MIHVENTRLSEVERSFAASHWALQLVLCWPDGEPLTLKQQDALARFYVSSEDTSIQAVDLEASQDVPYAFIGLSVEVSPFDAVIPTDDDDLPGKTAEQLLIDAAFSKAITTSLGGMALAGINLEELQLDAAYIAPMQELTISERASLHSVAQSRYQADEMAYDIFRDEMDMHNFLVSLSIPTSEPSSPFEQPESD
jgi:hypothetical protein